MDFKPYRVDLTPFAGLLNDGATHTVGVSVCNANSYFLATANVLVFTDHGASAVTGGVLSNTLSAAPTPVVTENITASSAGVYTGNIRVTSNRKFEISGYIDTSHGRVETTVQQSVDFSNYQTFDVNPNANAPDVQNVQQVSTVDSRTITRDGWQQRTLTQHFAYPLTIDYAFVQNADGSYSQITTIDQKDLVRETLRTNGFATDFSQLNNEVHATDTRNFDSGLNSVGNTGSKSRQTYVLQDSRGACHGRTISAAAQVLVSVDDGADCK